MSEEQIDLLNEQMDKLSAESELQVAVDRVLNILMSLVVEEKLD